jgi:hypothetical protein
MATIKLKKADGWEFAGVCAVDSGQILFVDPCYVEGGLDYEAVCGITLGDIPYGKILAEGVGGTGVAMSSGCGDGGYAVYVRHTEFGEWGKRVTAAIIDFCEEVEWDGDEEDNTNTEK